MLQRKIRSYILPAVLIAAGFSFQANAKSIKALTSKKSSEKVEKQVQEIASLNGNGLKVHALGIGIGQTFLNGDFADYGEDKITADLMYDYSASHSFSFMANLHYSKHEFKKTSTTIAGLALGLKAKLFNFDSFSPFASGGFGFYIPEVKRTNNEGKLADSEVKVTFGYHLGAGADLDLNQRVKVGVMFMLHNPFDVKQDEQAEVEGAYHKLLLTVYYKF